jgi:hypothetical protein
MSIQSEQENSIRRGKLMVWKLPKSTLANWSRLASDVPKTKAVDCVINSLHMLGVLKNRAFSEAIAKKVNTGKSKGLTEEQIINLLYEYVNRKEGVYNVETKTTVGMYDGNINEIKNGEYTFAGFASPKGMGHAVIIYKHNDQVYLYDPQQEQTCSETELLDWIESREFNNVEFIYYEKTARFRSKTKTKSKSNTQKKQRVSFDKNIAIFDVGMKPKLKQTTKKQKKKLKTTHLKKVSIDSLIGKFDRLKID